MTRIGSFVLPFSSSWWLPSVLLAFHLLLLIAAVHFWQYHHQYEHDFIHHERIYRLSASFDTEQGRRYLAAAPPGSHEWLEFFFGDSLEACTYLLPTEGAILSHAGQHHFSKYVFLSDSSFFEVFRWAGQLPYEGVAASTVWLNDSLARVLQLKEKPDTLDIRSTSALFFDGPYSYGGELSLPRQTHLQIDALLLGAPLTRRQQLSWRYVYVKMPVLLSAEAEQQWEKRITDSLNAYYADYKDIRFDLTAIDRLHLRTWGNNEQELAMGDTLPLILPQAVLAVASFLFAITAFYYALWLRMRWRLHRKEWFVRWVSGEAPAWLYVRYSLYVLAAWAGVVVLTGVLHEWLPYERWFMLPAVPFWQSITAWHWWGCTGACGVSLLMGIKQSRRFLPVYWQPKRSLLTRHITKFLWLPLWGQLFLLLAVGGVLGLLLQQLAYVERRPLGYDSRSLVLLRLPQYGVQASQLKEAEEALAKQPFVRAVGRVLEVPSDLLLPQLIVYRQRQGQMKWQQLLWGRMMVMEKAPDVLGVALRQGRYFKEEDDVRTTLIVNEEAYKELKGATVAFVTDSTGNPLPAQVIGVVRNFHFESLHRPIAPMVWIKGDGRIGNLLVRLHGKVYSKHLSAIKQVLVQVLPGVPVVEEKQHELVRRQYDYERVLLRLLGLAWVALIPGFLLTAWIGVRQWIGLRRRSVALYRLLGASVYDFLWQEMRIYFAFSCLTLPLILWVQYTVEKQWVQQYFAYFAPAWYYTLLIPVVLFIGCITILCLFIFWFWKRISLPEEFRV